MPGWGPVVTTADDQRVRALRIRAGLRLRSPLGAEPVDHGAAAVAADWSSSSARCRSPMSANSGRGSGSAARRPRRTCSTTPARCWCRGSTTTTADLHRRRRSRALDFNNGWFIKGYVGGGGLFGGKLKDEDFPPVIDALFGDAERQQERLDDLRQRRCRHQACRAARTSMSALSPAIISCASRRRLWLHPDRGQSGHLRPGDPGLRQGHLADQQLALAPARPRSLGRIRPALEAHASMPPGCPMCARSAPTRTWLRIGTNRPAISPARCRRTAGLGLPVRRRPVLSLSTNGSTSALGGRYWHMRPRATPISRAMWSGSTRCRRSSLEGRPFRRLHAGQRQVRPLSVISGN